MSSSSLPRTHSRSTIGFSVLLSLALSMGIGRCFGQALDGSKAPGAEWWKHAVIYEIYPRSFQDSNGDGTGDLKGITQRLGYLEALGVDAIWLTPVYPSPQIDFGYDISDYKNIDPQYGTLADFDRLVAEARKRHIRILMDMVMNHTSDKHPWFLESSSSKTNPKRDWYIWRDGKDDGPPNNWQSCFGHSAWQYDARTRQWYYHMFYPEQPDLNWRNPEVEEAMFNAVRFWLDRGVAGFRLDAVTTLFEDPELQDGKVSPGTNAYGDPLVDASVYTDNLPEVHDVMKRLRLVVNSYPGDRVLIGETYLPNIGELDKWYGGAAHDQLQLPMDMLVGFTNKLDASLFRQRIEDVETKVHGGQPLIVFDNHDRQRSWNRYGDGVHNTEIARLLAALLFTTHATATMYYGQELGMVTSPPVRKEDVKDPIGIKGWPKEKGRDGERTPMQWNARGDAGFSNSAHPWLPIAANYKQVNVETEEQQPESLLNWYKNLIQLRRTTPALKDGSMVMLDATNPSVLSFRREDAAHKADVVVALNFTAQPQTVSLESCSAGRSAAKTLLASGDSNALATVSLCSLVLAPYAVWIGSVAP